MKIEHELFAHHYIITGDKDKAYKAAYPQAEGEALKTAARRLINEPDVRKFIHENLATDRQQAILIHHYTEQERANEEYATLMLQRKVLRGMIVGTHKVRKHIRVKDRIEVVEDDISPFAILQAIDKDAKLTHNWYSKHIKPAAEKPAKLTDKEKQELSNKGYTLPLPPIREGHDIPLHLQIRELVDMGREEFLEKHYGPDFAPALRALEIQDKPYMADNYKRLGLRILDHIPTQEEMYEMRGIYAYNRKLEAEKRAQQLAEKGTITNPDGTVPFPELYYTQPEEEPLSIPAVFTSHVDTPSQDDTQRTSEIAQNTSGHRLQRGPNETAFATPTPKAHEVEEDNRDVLSPAGAVSASGVRGGEVRAGGGSLTQENEEDRQNTSSVEQDKNSKPLKYTAPGATYYHKGTPQAQAEREYLISKGVNPASFPPQSQIPLSKEQIQAEFGKIYDQLRKDPESPLFQSQKSNEEISKIFHEIFNGT